MPVDPSKLKAGQWCEYDCDIVFTILSPARDGQLDIETDKGLVLRRSVNCAFWAKTELIEDGV